MRFKEVFDIAQSSGVETVATAVCTHGKERCRCLRDVCTCVFVKGVKRFETLQWACNVHVWRRPYLASIATCAKKKKIRGHLFFFTEASYIKNIYCTVCSYHEFERVDQWDAFNFAHVIKNSNNQRSELVLDLFLR